MLDYQVVPLPDPWPGKVTPGYARKRSPFKTIWTKVVDALEREIAMLGGRGVTIAVDVDLGQLRNDGMLKSNARPRSSSVVVSFKVGADLYQFPCDTFAFWQDNVSAIARALEALRMVDRYGVQQGRQYQGFKALPSSTSVTWTTERAVEIVSRFAGDAVIADQIAKDRGIARDAVRLAAARTHPDRGGNADDFALVQTAKKLLEAHHGGAL